MAARILLAVGAIVAGVSNWVTAVEHRGPDSGAIPQPREIERLILTGPDVETRRREMLRRAALHAGSAPELPRIGAWSCRFVHDTPSGTTPKFACVLDDGEVVKVKYGRHPEIHAEVAASRLLRALGYPSDTVAIAPHLRCYGCPRYPFLGSYVLTNAVTRHLLARREDATGYTDFEWVAVERRFPARPIETDSTKGWHWWELADANSEARAQRRADVDALKLLAVFLAHWDNKAENQRLVCLDDNAAPEDCRRPLALIQDLGATFGPMKVNLARWRELPVWHDRASCMVSMRALPHRGASFGDTVISEAGRAQLAARLGSLTEHDVRKIFADARFPAYQTGTDDEKDLDAWVGAFEHRVEQIRTAGPCPT